MTFAKVSSLFIRPLFIMLLLVFFQQTGLAIDLKWKELVKEKIEKKIKKNNIKNSDLALYIAGGEGVSIPVYTLNAKEKMIPASITKLITAAATITQFPPGTKFKTQLLSSAAIENSKLKGNLILKGGGDPSFVSENLWVLVNNFLRNNITEIQGDIIVDDSLFDASRIDFSRQKERVDRAYDAPTGAMSFNWNSVNVFVRPSKLGQPAYVFADPENEYILLKGSIKTVSAGGKTTISVEREENSKNSKDIINVSGAIAADSKEIVVYKNISQPDIWSGYNLKAFLKQRGIAVTGAIKSGVTPSDAKLMAESESRPVENILSDMNKFSNNYVAEMLIKSIAAANDPPGTIEKGVKSIKNYLKKLEVSENDFEIENPSGLTRKNKITAEVLWKVLNDMRFQFRYQPEFVTSLPIAGIDGTLKNRMKNSVAERWVRAKTGLLTGVVSLAGYAGRVDGTVLPFVFIYNGRVDEGRMRQLFDEIAALLVE